MQRKKQLLSCFISGIHQIIFSHGTLQTIIKALCQLLFRSKAVRHTVNAIRRLMVSTFYQKIPLVIHICEHLGHASGKQFLILFAAGFQINRRLSFFAETVCDTSAPFLQKVRRCQRTIDSFPVGTQAFPGRIVFQGGRQCR